MRTRTAHALIVVDVQNDFCEGGGLAVTGGNSTASAIARHIDRHAHRYDLIVFTADWHVNPDGHFAPDGADPDFVDTWPVHCLADTDGAAFHPALDGLVNPTDVFRKGAFTASYSGFDGTDPDGRTLDERLRAADVGQVDVVGIAFDFCVAQTAVDAATNGYVTRVLEPLTAAVAAPLPDGTTTADRARQQMLDAHVNIERAWSLT